MSHEWQEIPIEDVQPGDVARCNGREFRVMETHEDSRRKWYVALGGYHMCDYDRTTIDALGFTFHRKVKLEPRTFRGTVTDYGPRLQSVTVALHPNGCLPLMGSEVEITEILDGEDGS